MQNRLPKFLLVIVLFLLPSLYGYFYLQPFRQWLIRWPFSDFWSSILPVYALHLTTLGLLSFLLRREVHPLTVSNITERLTLNRFQWRDLLFGFLLLLIAGGAGLLLLNLFHPEFTLPPFSIADLSGAVVVAYLVALLLTVLAEELYFRAYLLRRILDYSSLDWIINAVLFALYTWFTPQPAYFAPQPLYYTLLTALPTGLAMAFLFQWRRNVYPGLAARIIASLVTFVAFLKMPMQVGPL